MPISKIKAGGINDDAVTTAKIVDGTVAAVDIADGAVTSAKLDTNIDIDGTLDVTSTLTADGNVFVGHTSQYSPIQNGGSGVTLNTNGQVFAGGQFPSYFNREDSDGDVLVFRQDGAAAGNIGTTGSGALLHIGLRQDATNPVGLGGSGSDTGAVMPVTTAGAERDANINLGKSGARFKNLYLSGGVYLGGTGSANYLDDYEEGTWTPNYEGSSTAGTVTYVNRGGMYTKIGNQVTCWFSLVNFSVSGASGSVRVTGLPFQSSVQNNVRGAYSGNIRMYRVNLDNDRDYVNIGVDGGTSFIGFLQWTDDAAWIAQPVENDSGQYIEGYVTYTTS